MRVLLFTKVSIFSKFIPYGVWTTMKATDHYYDFGWLVGWLVLLLYVPKSTAMVIAGRSVHLTTLFPGQA